MLRLLAYAVAGVFAVLAALAFLLAASYQLQAPRAGADLAGFRAGHQDTPAVVDHTSRSSATAAYVIHFKDPPGVQPVVEVDPYLYAAALRPGDQVTLRLWKGRVAEVLTPAGVVQTPDDPALIAEDSSPTSVLRTIGLGMGYSLLATAIVVAARRWTAPLLGRK